MLAVTDALEVHGAELNAGKPLALGSKIRIVTAA